MSVKDMILWMLAIPDRLYNRLMLSYRSVRYEKDLRIKGRIRIYGRGTIEIGKGVRINSCRSANPIGGDAAVVLSTDVGGHIVIGDGSAMSNCAIVSKKEVRIGRDVRIGGSCKIYDTDFHSLSLEKRISSHDDDIVTNPVEICDGAFIGASSIILKGVRIGKKSIVGAGSVVTRDIPDGEIWAGNPAKFIRKLEVTDSGR